MVYFSKSKTGLLLEERLQTVASGYSRENFYHPHASAGLTPKN